MPNKTIKDIARKATEYMPRDRYKDLGEMLADFHPPKPERYSRIKRPNKPASHEPEKPREIIGLKVKRPNKPTGFFESATNGLYLVYSDGTEEQIYEREFSSQIQISGDSFSPDKKHILLAIQNSRFLDSCVYSLMVIDVDGTNPTRILENYSSLSNTIARWTNVDRFCIEIKDSMLYGHNKEKKGDKDLPKTPVGQVFNTPGYYEIRINEANLPIEVKGV